MLQNIRDNAQGWIAWVIVILISIPFALWGIHEYMQPKADVIVAEVNDVEILQREFQRNVQQRRQQLRAMLKQDVDLSFMDAQIKQTTLEQMIEEEILVQSALQAGMRVGDALLAERIHQFPMFQDQGQFSQKRYEEALHYQGLNPALFEQQIRRMVLTEQLQQGLFASALVTAYDSKVKARLKNQQRAVSYLIIPSEHVKDQVTVDETEIETYYTEHQTQFMTPEKVSIEYVTLSKESLAQAQSIDEDRLKQFYQERLAHFTTPAKVHARHILLETDPEASATEIQAAEQHAQELLTKLEAGAHFETLAQEFSDDPTTAKQGGDLGWFQLGSGEQIKAIEESVAELEEGEISTPVKSQFGYHLIQLIERQPEVTQPFEAVKAELKETLQIEQADSEFYSQLEQFSNLAFEHPNSLEVLADSLNLTIHTTEPFTQAQQPEDEDSILAHQQILEAAFSEPVLKEGFNSEVIEIGEQQVVVLRVKTHEASTAQPLAEVREDIIALLTRQKNQKATQELGQSLLTALKQDNSDPQAVAQAHDLSWSNPQWITRADTTLKQPKIVTEAFKMGHPQEQQAIYRGIELANSRYALIALLAVNDGEKVAAEPAQQQQRASGESIFNQFVEALKNQAEIKIYKENIS